MQKCFHHVDVSMSRHCWTEDKEAEKVKPCRQTGLLPGSVVLDPFVDTVLSTQVSLADYMQANNQQMKKKLEVNLNVSLRESFSHCRCPHIRALCAEVSGLLGTQQKMNIIVRGDGTVQPHGRGPISSVDLVGRSRRGRQPHIKQVVGENVPEDGAEHKQGVDTEKDPKQGLFLESLLIILQDHYAQGETNHHPTKVSYKAGVRTWRKGRWVEP